MNARAIAGAVPSQSMTEFERSRPAWRSPMLTVGRLRLGASMMPLEELPTTTSHKRFALDGRPRAEIAIEELNAFATVPATVRVEVAS